MVFKEGKIRYASRKEWSALIKCSHSKLKKGILILKARGHWGPSLKEYHWKIWGKKTRLE